MNHDKKRVYDFFKYSFNKMFRSLLENDTNVSSCVFGGLMEGRGEVEKFIADDSLFIFLIIKM